MAGVILGPIEPGSSLYGRAEGAVILAVKKGSRAAKAGLRVGDVIIGVNQKQVHSPKDVVSQAEEKKDRLLLQIMREGAMLFIAIA